MAHQTAKIGAAGPADASSVAALRRRWSETFDLARPGNQHKLGYILLIPAVLLIAAIIAYPLILSINLSLQDVKIARIGADDQPWTLKNYQTLFTSPEFWHSCWVTIRLVLTVTIACFVIGMGTALLLNQVFRGRKLARLLVALPWAIPEVVAVIGFWWIFDSSFGVVNWALVTLGITVKPIAWFSSGSGAFFVVAVVMIWKGYPFVSIMLLAGLQAIPNEFYEAARVDGATAWQRFTKITLPTLSPVLNVTLVLVMLWVFRDFSIIYVLTQGGPINATETLGIMTYEQAFSFFKMGYASAVGVVTLIICAIAARFMVRRVTQPLY